MPSQNGFQHRLFEMGAHDPKKVEKATVPQSAVKNFVVADIGRKFGTITEKAKRGKPSHAKK